MSEENPVPPSKPISPWTTLAWALPLDWFIFMKYRGTDFADIMFVVIPLVVLFLISLYNSSIRPNAKRPNSKKSSATPGA